MRKVLTLLLSMLSACADQRAMPPSSPTAAQRELRDMRLLLDAGARQADECIDAIERTTEYQHVADRLVFGPDQPMTILAYAERPTEADVPLLLAIHRQLAGCRAGVVHNLRLVHPAFVPGTELTFREGDIDFAKLVRREITWGQYAELTIGRVTRFEQRLREAARQVMARLRN